MIYSRQFSPLWSGAAEISFFLSLSLSLSLSHSCVKTFLCRGFFHGNLPTLAKKIFVARMVFLLFLLPRQRSASSSQFKRCKKVFVPFPGYGNGGKKPIWPKGFFSQSLNTKKTWNSEYGYLTWCRTSLPSAAIRSDRIRPSWIARWGWSGLAVRGGTAQPPHGSRTSCPYRSPEGGKSVIL